MPALIVSVELLPAVTDVGLKLALAPAGRPDTAGATVSALPLVTAVEIVEVPLAPWFRVSVFGPSASEKSLVTTGLIVNVTVVVWVALASGARDRQGVDARRGGPAVERQR